MHNTERMNARFDTATVKRLYQDGKAGTAGWTVQEGVNTWMQICPASQTGAILVMPLPGLQVGDRLVGFDLIGQIDCSGGGDVTLGGGLHRFTAVNTGCTSAAVGGWSMTQIAITAAVDTKLDATNAQKIPDAVNQVVVADGETYFMLLTATTAASSDIEILAVRLHIQPAR